VAKRRGRQNRRAEARMRVDALATATTKGYLGAATRLMRELPIGKPITFHGLATVLERRVSSGLWASHNIRAYTTDTLSAMAWLNLPIPQDMCGKRRDWLMRSLEKTRSSRGPRRRKTVSTTRLERVLAHIELGKHGVVGELAKMAAWVGFLGMMRTNELRKLTARELKLRRSRTGDQVIRIRIAGKSHYHRNRRIAVPILDEFRDLIQPLAQRLASLPMNGRLWPSQAWAILKRGLAHVKRRPGGLRGGGNTFWREAGAKKAIIHANGGWSGTSQIPAKHYTTVSGTIVENLRKRAQRRFSAAW